MKIIILLVSLPVLLSAFRLFLMGGAVANNNTELYVALANATGRTATPNKCDSDWSKTTCPRIAVITSAAANEAAGNDAYSVDETGSLSYATLFSNYGFSPRHVSAHIDNYKSATNISSAIGVLNYNMLMQADIIFFNGGDQARHARTWLEDNGVPNQMLAKILQRASNNEVIFSGTSAGNMILSSPTYGEGCSFGQLYFTNKVGLAPKKPTDGAVNGTGLKDMRNGTSGLQYSDNGGWMAGIPTFNTILLDTHFDARGRLVRLIPGLKETNKTIGIGVDEDTALYIDQRNISSVYGTNGVFIADATRATFNRTSASFGASDVRVHYLTSGDRVNLSDFSVTSSKSEITNPYYSNPTDSNDFASSYQATLLMTRLVDQKGSYNLGKTKTLSGYPRDTPIFVFRIEKDSRTKGYYSNKKYTVVNALISVYENKAQTSNILKEE